MSALGRRIRRIVLGPSADTTGPQPNTSAPTPTTAVGRVIRDDGTLGEWVTVGPGATVRPVVDAPDDPNTAHDPLIRIPTGDAMSDDTVRAHNEPGNEAAGDPYDSMKGGVSDVDEFARARRDDSIDVALTDSGVHALDEPADTTRPMIKSACTTCEGRGYVERTVNELLRESIALIPVDGGDMVIKEFYTRLLHAAPHLVPLFPRDLLVAATQDGASPGALQRDRLLNALVALSELYGSNAQDMERLDSELARFGRSHAAFARPDGTVQGATPAEYMVVKDVLFGTLVDVAGSAWRPEYTAAWDEAYDYAMVNMLYAQYHSGLRAARYPRRAGE